MNPRPTLDLNAVRFVRESVSDTKNPERGILFVRTVFEAPKMVYERKIDEGDEDSVHQKKLWLCSGNYD